MFRTILTLFLLLAASFIQADIYKCNDGGKIVYQGKPCKGEVLDSKVKPKDKSSKEALSVQFEREAETSEIELMKKLAKNYLSHALKDPESLKDLSWNFFEKRKYGYAVSFSYRAKNSYGAYTGIQESIMYLHEDFDLFKVL